jgi:hypothetical protein
MELAQDRVQWLALVLAVLNLQVSANDPVVDYSVGHQTHKAWKGLTHISFVTWKGLKWIAVNIICDYL